MTYIKITIKCSHYFICTFILIKGSNTVQAELLKGYPNAEVATDMASSVVKAIKYVTKSSMKIIQVGTWRNVFSNVSKLLAVISYLKP